MPPAGRRALVIHHDADSSVGLVGDALRRAGVDLVEHTICPRLADPTSDGPLPALAGVDLLVLLGSRWSVYDRDRIGGWIDDELALVRRAAADGVPTLGICFGGQVLAAAFGGTVAPAPVAEIGWSAVTPDPPPAGTTGDDPIGTGPWFQWHVDAFTVPDGAVTLAHSPAGPQAFRRGRALGLQFHPELDRPLLDLWLAHDADELVAMGIDPDRLRADTDARAAEVAPRTDRLVRWFLDEVADPS